VRVGSGFTDMYQGKKGVRALGTVLRQNLEVSWEIPAEMLVLLLRLARADMARLPLPDPEKATGIQNLACALVAEPINTTEFAR
jgi:hypothetical protein